MEKCCLWINGKKVAHPDEIRDCFNITDIRGYYLGGKLSEWLRAFGENEKADKVDRIHLCDNKDQCLYEIFGVEYEKPDYHKCNAVQTVRKAGSSYTGSFTPSSFSTSSFNSTSFNANTSFSTSFRTSTSFTTSFSTSFRLSGSFRIFGSFNAGSFSTAFSNGYMGSFVYDRLVELLAGKDIEKALLSYTSEPLNQYGYGINLV